MAAILDLWQGDLRLIVLYKYSQPSVFFYLHSIIKIKHVFSLYLVLKNRISPNSNNLTAIFDLCTLLTYAYLICLKISYLLSMVYLTLKSFIKPFALKNIDTLFILFIKNV